MSVNNLYGDRKILTLALIAKNEEKHIQRFVDSWQGWYDELIIVDTGSEDATKEIAKRCGAVVADFEWCGSFEKARNAACELATSEWIFCPDCDEIIVNGENFYKFLAESPDYLTAVQLDLHTSWANYQDWQNKGEVLNYFPAQRTFKRGTHKWIGDAHEYIGAIDGHETKMGYCTSAHFEHHPDNTKSRSFYIDILRKQANENPNDGRYLHYMGREAMYYNNNVEAIGYFERCIDHHHWDFERCQTRLYMANCYLKLGDEKKALEQMFLSMMEEPSRRDSTFGIAEYYRSKEDWPKAIIWYRMALSLDKPQTSYFMNDELYGALPYLRLTQCYYNLRDIGSSRKYFELAKQVDPKHPEIKQNEHLFWTPKVTIVIPTRFRDELLQRCLNAIKETSGSYQNIEVVVLKDEDEVPLGCPKATNKAVASAFSSEKKPAGWIPPEYICFLGNDTIPQPNWLIEAMMMMKTFPEGKGMIGLNNGYGAGQATHFVIHKDMLDFLPDKKLFCEEYTHNFVDNELSERMEALGRYKWCPRAMVHHSWHAQNGTSPGVDLRPLDDCDKYAGEAYQKDLETFERRRALWYKEPTFGVQVLAWRDDWVIEQTLKRLLKVFEPDQILGVMGKPYAEGNWPEDETRNIFAKYKIPVIDVEEATEEERRNKALDTLNKDYCFIVDADELWDPDDLKKIMNLVKGNRTVECVLAKCYTYWKTPEWRIDPPEPLNPAVLVKSKAVRFVQCRLNNAQVTAFAQNVYFHHYSYVGDDARIQQKLAHLGSPACKALHNVIPDWFENVWQKWTPEMENIHPTHPECYKRAVRVEPLENL